ncbi:MAG: type II toxin-antitoxin system VapC family toxin [Acidobacteriota bacterium]|jgi:PIN domain nuclease of toxin-antitoxin system|nr:type II toxin-antitoxin system VapC family toxin [Acidobacteriota bacterium]
MRYLIDTNIFLWFVSNAKELSQTAKDFIEDGNNEIFLSIASLWEISIKNSLGKLTINGKYESVIDDVNDNSIQILPINFAHTVEQNRLNFHHRDPFDRIIISQAIVENINLISADSIFDNYVKGKSIKRIW